MTKVTLCRFLRKPRAKGCTPYPFEVPQKEPLKFKVNFRTKLKDTCEKRNTVEGFFRAN